MILLGSAFAFFYHLCNGVRHMWWDIGWGFKLEQVTQSGYAVLGASVVLTVIVLIVAL
ncbi:MAG: succinate dehydrogenase, cytochrome b556 subunit [Pseudomonadota bacterium]